MGAEPDLVFYDGGCGLCHGLVGFLARRDPHSRFAPLQGPTFRERVPEALRRELSDSLVVLREGRLLTRSEAALYVLGRAGGMWALLAALARPLPRGFQDGVYGLVARARRRWSRPPGTLCPRVPPELRDRFLP